MSEESVAATVYSYWHLMFMKGLMQMQTSKSQTEGKVVTKEITF